MKITNSINWLSQPKHLFWGVFFYTIGMGLFVQFILLPYILPSWHDEFGLIKKMDGMIFHRIATELAQQIKLQGWAVWEPTPQGQFVSGMAAITYTLIYPMPWSVLPINAILNASACVCFYFLMMHFVDNRQKALVASLPFIFYPSNLLWNTQFHNENYAVPSVIFILYGWVLITKKDVVKTTQFSFAILLISIGSLFLGFVRSYILSGMISLFVIACIGLIIYWVVTTQIQEFLKRFVFISLAITSMLLMLFIVQNDKNLLIYEELIANNVNISNSSTSKSGQNRKWNTSDWLPSALDNQIRKIAKKRTGFVKAWAEASSSIDTDVTFQSIEDMMAYIPRAAQIGFLSPFPNSWFISGKRATSQGMRLASAIEMLFSYFCLIGLPLFIWQQKKSVPFWVVIFLCTSMLIIYAMIIPNIGSLYRFRYPYYMPLICFGLAGWLLKNYDAE